MKSPVTEQQARDELLRLVKERGTNLTALSRMIGRNQTYLQQYVRRGSPAWLEERDRRVLADFLGVDERSIDGSGGASTGRPTLLIVPRLDVQASAGPGATPGLEATLGHYGFDRAWLKRISGGKPENLSIVKVMGDSMSPTLVDGDDILVDRLDGGTRVREGMYVLERDDALLVKRVGLGPAAGRLHITSDNPAYPSWPDCDAREVRMVGRVVWAGRRFV